MIQVAFFSNGVTMVFRDGSQIPELQVSWFELFLEHMRDELGVDPRDVHFTMPDERFAKVFRTDGDNEFNWTIGDI